MSINLVRMSEVFQGAKFFVQEKNTISNYRWTLNMSHIKKILKKKELLLRKPRNPKSTAYNQKVFETYLVKAVSCE